MVVRNLSGTQFNAVAQPQFDFEQTFDTKLWNPVVKGTYQLNQNHKIIGYYQWGHEGATQPAALCHVQLPDAGPTLAQKSSSWVYKAEWNGTLSDKLYLEARYGDFGYYFPLIAIPTRSIGSARYRTYRSSPGRSSRWQLDRDRKQLTSAATMFLDTDEGEPHAQVRGEMLT